MWRIAGTRERVGRAQSQFPKAAVHGLMMVPKWFAIIMRSGGASSIGRRGKRHQSCGGRCSYKYTRVGGALHSTRWVGVAWYTLPLYVLVSIAALNRYRSLRRSRACNKLVASCACDAKTIRETRGNAIERERMNEERWRDWFNSNTSFLPCRPIDRSGELFYIFTHGSFICVMLTLFLSFFFLLVVFILKDRERRDSINYPRNDGRWTIGNGEGDLRFSTPSRVGIKIYEMKELVSCNLETWLGESIFQLEKKFIYERDGYRIE